MTIAIDVPAVDFFRASPTQGIAEGSRVDRKENVIYGAKIIEMGEVNDDRPWFVDEVTMSQTVEFGNRSNRGAKSRYTHPTMSGDGMGKHLGRWKDLRVEGDAVYADLHIADSAFNTPSGDLATYVMDLAEEDPEAFGVSLAPKLDFDEMESLEEDGKQPIRLSSLHAADIVGDPAATRGGFFGMDDLTADLPTHVTWILDNHFADRSFSELTGRLDGYLRKYFKLKGRSIDVDLADDQTPDGEISMNATLRKLCINSGMNEDLSDEDAQAWLAEHAGEVLGSTERDTLSQQVADLTAKLDEVVSKTDDEALAAKHKEETDAASLAASKRASEILALCETAGCADKAREYIDKPEFSVDGVRTDLFAEVCARNKRVPDDTDPPPKPADTFEAACREEYDAGNFACDFDAYLASRKVDEGMVELRPATDK